MSLKAFEHYMTLGLNSRDIAEQGDPRPSYCGACNKSHAKQWFRGPAGEFYICRVHLTVVVKEGDKYTNYSPDKFVAIFPLDASVSSALTSDSRFRDALKKYAIKVGRCFEFRFTVAPLFEIAVRPADYFDSSTPFRVT
jgi:hypothetical protein